VKLFCEVKLFPLQAWSGPDGSRKLRFSDFMTTAQDGAKVVSLTHRPSLPPRKCSWYSLLLEDVLAPDPDVDGRIILRWIFRKWEPLRMYGGETVALDNVIS
jgi:hypothetical protein